MCAEFVLISPPKLCVIFAFKTPIYLMRDNFHLSFRGPYKAQEGIFYLLSVGSGIRGLPEIFLKTGSKWCILCPFFA